MFKVEVAPDEVDNQLRWLRVSHNNGASWSSIQVRSDDEAFQIISALQLSVSGIHAHTAEEKQREGLNTKPEMKMKVQEFLKKASEEFMAAGCKPQPTKEFSSPIRVVFGPQADMNYRNMTHMIQDLRASARTTEEIQNADDVIVRLIEEMKGGENE